MLSWSDSSEALFSNKVVFFFWRQLQQDYCILQILFWVIHFLVRSFCYPPYSFKFFTLGVYLNRDILTLCLLIARNLLLAPLQFYVVVLLTTRLLLLPLMGGRHLNQAQWRLAEECQASFSEDRKLVFSFLMTEAPRSGHALFTGSERQASANSRKHGQRCRWFGLTRITCSVVHSEGVSSTRFLPALSLAVFSGTSLNFVPFINQLFFIDSIVLYSLMEMIC